MVVPMIARGSVVGVVSFVSAETGHRVRRRRPLARREPRLARRDRDRERAPVRRALGDRALAAGLAAAADPARRAGLRAGRGLPLRQRGHGGRRRLLRRLQHGRGPVVRDRRRRLRQGRRGRRGDGDGALHDPGGGRAAALAGGDPAAARRGDAAPGVARAGRPLLHDRVPAPGPLALAGARDGRLRRASAAGGPARRRHRSRSSARPGRCSAWSSGPSCTTARATCIPGDTVVLYTDGLTEAGAPQRVWGPAELADVLRGAAGRRAAGGRGPRRARGARRAGRAARRHRGRRAARAG